MAYYDELNNIVNNIIGEKILRNQVICKMLYYYPTSETLSYNPLLEPDIEDTSILYMKNVYPLPKKPDAETKEEGFILVNLKADNEYDAGTGYKKVTLIFDIINHLKTWVVDGGYRPYIILSQIDEMINNKLTDLPIVNKPLSLGFYPRDYSHYFYGVQATYQLTVNSNVICNPSPQNLNIDKLIYTTPSYLPKNLGL